MIVIDVRDPLAEQLNDLADIEKVMPGQLAVRHDPLPSYPSSHHSQATNEWFRIYKIPAGSPENTFAFNGEAKDKAFTTAIVLETHEAWKSLISGAVSNAKINTYAHYTRICPQGSPAQHQHHQCRHRQAHCPGRRQGRGCCRARGWARCRPRPLRHVHGLLCVSSDRVQFTSGTTSVCRLENVCGHSRKFS